MKKNSPFEKDTRNISRVLPEQNAKVVVAITSRALFDLKKENDIFQKKGTDAYYRYQRNNEKEVLSAGAGFPLVKALLALNSQYAQLQSKLKSKQKGKQELSPAKRLVEVVIISKNSPEAGIRIFNSIKKHNLDISKGIFLGGESAVNYLGCFNTDLFLSMEDGDVRDAHEMGVAAGRLYEVTKPEVAIKVKKTKTTESLFSVKDEKKVRIALDADRVVFSGDSEEVFDKHGIEEFNKIENKKAKTSLPPGPFGKFIRTMSELKKEFPIDDCPISLSIVTARNSKAHERVLRTLRAWDVKIDKIFFMGGAPKNTVLEQLRPHIFFDDKQEYIDQSKDRTPSAEVMR